MISALIGAFGVACISLISVFFFGTRGKLSGAHKLILPVAVGVFLGIVFFELVPETFEASETWGGVAIMFGFLGFYLLSHFLDTFHHHHTDSHDECSKNGAQKLLVGDAIHNFADGIVIASAFMINPVAGILTTIGIALHEIPQEIAEFGVLLQSGYTRSQATRYNFISALSVLIGVCATYLFASALDTYLFILTGIAAGNLLYIATADLIPELRHSHRDHFFKTFFATLCGVVVIASLITYTHHLEELRESTQTPTGHHA